jgi:NADH-quinone oxidoreductase subunit C
MLNIAGLIEQLNNSENGQVIFADKENIVELLKVLKEQHKYSRLIDLTAVDYETHYEVVYHLINDEMKLLAVRVKLEKSDSVIPSITSLWEAANAQEREVYDLMGIAFEGHADLKRILCPDDFVGHPLQKSFKLNTVNRF